MITLENLLSIYNFRHITDADTTDTQIVRVYEESCNPNYAEIGTYDFSFGRMIGSFINQSYLERNVESIRVENNTLRIYLESSELQNCVN